MFDLAAPTVGEKSMNPAAILIVDRLGHTLKFGVHLKKGATTTTP